jgi:FkbM family methyltransferase
MIKHGLSAIKGMITSAERRFQLAKYSKYGPDHIFDITVDDLSLKMTFLGRNIGNAILERIQGRREPTTVSVIRALVKPGSKVLELGGCYGYFTYIMASCAGAGGQVVSIEGTPNNYRILTRNIELNNLKNVAAYNLFITDKADHVTYAAGDQDPYQAIDRLTKGITTGTSANVTVPTVRLSSFLNEIGFAPDYVFMDIEGFEIDVFKDFDREYLLKHRPVIVFEIHKQFYKGEDNLDLIKGILSRNNYYYRKDGDNLLCFPNRD